MRAKAILCGISPRWIAVERIFDTALKDGERIVRAADLRLGMRGILGGGPRVVCLRRILRTMLASNCDSVVRGGDHSRPVVLSRIGDCLIHQTSVAPMQNNNQIRRLD